VPVTGGNVSLYNESATGPIYPTPVIGMVGRLPDARRAGRLGFAREGDTIALAGWDAAPSLAGGELAKLWGEPLPDGLPAVDLAQAAAVLEAVRGAVRAGALSSCHDVAEGGLLVALAECCLAGGLGAALHLAPGDDPWCHLFGERPVGFVLSGPHEALDALARSVPLDVFGTVGGDALELTIAGETSRWALAELREAHGALGRFFP
jgi:phosphoribosylformylglycinamidine synthase subunit PurL